MSKTIDDLIAHAREQLEAAPLITKHVELGGEMVGVRLPRVRGDEWRELTAKYLPRDGSFTDQNLGYNTDAVLREYPRVSIDREGEIDDLIRREDDGSETYIWPEVFTLLEAPALEILVQALWEAHEYVPQQRMIAAGKALRAGRAKKRSSPANSESPSAN